VSRAEYWVHFLYRTQMGMNLACCLIANWPDGDLGEYMFTSYLLYQLYGLDPTVISSSTLLSQVYGYDDATLNCSNINAFLGPKPSGFCNAAPDYSLRGLRSLTSTPGAPPYVGVSRLIERFTEQNGTDLSNPAVCGAQRCNGRGFCNTDGVTCTCNPGSWGTTCQFGEFYLLHISLSLTHSMLFS
jgi:hypothetical protein